MFAIVSSCSRVALIRRSSAGDRVAVLVLVIEDLAVRLDGRGGLVEVGLAQLREADQQRDLLVRLLDERELAADVVAEVAPRLALDVEPVERAQRLQVIRRLAEDLGVDRDRLVGRVQHLLVDRGDAEQELEALVGLVRDVDPAAIDLEQLGVLLVAREDRLERGERRRGRRARSRARA